MQISHVHKFYSSNAQVLIETWASLFAWWQHQSRIKAAIGPYKNIFCFSKKWCFLFFKLSTKKFFYSESLQQSFVDEDGCHETGEDVLGEPGEVLDQHGSLKSGKDDGNDGRPNGDPDPARQELDPDAPGKLDQGFVVNQDWTRNAYCDRNLFD